MTRLTLPTVVTDHTAATKARLALMRAMAADGIPVAEIAAALDYAPSTVRVMACRAGIQLPRLKPGRKRRART